MTERYDTDKVRAGREAHEVRYVLAFGCALAVVAMAGLATYFA